MNTVQVTSNVAEWQNSMLEYIKAFRLNRKEAMQKEGAALGRTLIKLTPPRTKKQGVDRVERDLSHILFGLKKKPKPHPVTSLGPDYLVLFKEPSGRLVGVAKRDYQPDATPTDLAAWHARWRDRRGRVTRKTLKLTQTGPITVVDALVTKAATAEQYVRERQLMVGQARGGWASGTAHFGGQVAAWVQRHSGAGSFVDGLDTPQEFLQFNNASAWAKDGESARIAENALASRAETIRNKIEAADEKAQTTAFKSGRNLTHLPL